MFRIQVGDTTRGAELWAKSWWTVSDAETTTWFVIVFSKAPWKSPKSLGLQITSFGCCCCCCCCCFFLFFFFYFFPKFSFGGRWSNLICVFLTCQDDPDTGNHMNLRNWGPVGSRAPFWPVFVWKKQVQWAMMWPVRRKWRTICAGQDANFCQSVWSL